MLLLWAFTAAAGPWEALGPVPPPARLVQEASGPDLVRAEIEENGAHYWIDVTVDRGGTPFCRGGGYAIQVRHDLDHDEESFELDPVPPPVARACAQLAPAGPALARSMSGAPALEPTPADALERERPGPDGSPVDSMTASGSSTPGAWWSPGHRPFALFHPRPFQAVVIGWFFAAVVALGVSARRAPRAALVAFTLFGAALALRLRYAPVTVILGGDAAYERLTSALGRGATDRYYGETWTSLFGLLHELTARLGLPLARATDLVHDVNLLASAACAPLVWGLARRAEFARFPAFLAGGAMAVLPHAVSLAAIEDHAVLVGTLQLITGFAVLGAGAPNEALAVLSAAMLAHLRPDQLPTAGALLLPLVARRRWAAFAVGVALVGARLAYLDPPSGSGPIQFTRLLDVQAWPMLARAWVGAPAVPMPGLYVLALLGAATAIRPSLRALSRPVTLWLVGVLLATTLLYLPKDIPAADPLRFSLPAEGWLVLLAAIGACAVVGAVYGNGRRPLVIALLAGLGIFDLTRASSLAFPRESAHARPWAWEEEYRFLLAHLPTAPAGDPADLTLKATSQRGWYDDAQDPNGAFGRWLTVASGVVWMPWSTGSPHEGDLVYRGSADRLAGRWLGERCGLDPLSELEAAPNSDGWVDFGAAPVRFSLYRVRECGDPAAR